MSLGFPGSKVAPAAIKSSCGSSQSRSTSADSSTDQLFEDMVLPLRVKNTFIDERIRRPNSLEGFFQEREVHSCPASRVVSFDEVGAPPGLEDLFAFIDNVTSKGVGHMVDPREPREDIPLHVKNTFIHDEIGRPFSLEGFFNERAARSCPASRGVSLDDFHTFAAESVLAQAEPTPCPYCETPQLGAAIAFSHCSAMPLELELLLNGVGAADFQAWVPPPLIPVNHAPVYIAPQMPMAAPHPLPTVEPLESGARKLLLAGCLPEPELGSSLLPTLGSAGHRHGTCRPCAFFHTKGCTSGVECTFCHLCDAGARKTRKQEKVQARRIAKVGVKMCEPLAPR